MLQKRVQPIFSFHNIFRLKKTFLNPFLFFLLDSYAFSFVALGMNCKKCNNEMDKHRVHMVILSV